jgi:hypothetical protein
VAAVSILPTADPATIRGALDVINGKAGAAPVSSTSFPVESKTRWRLPVSFVSGTSMSSARRTFWYCQSSWWV